MQDLELLGVHHGPRIAAFEMQHGDVVSAQLQRPQEEWDDELADFVGGLAAGGLPCRPGRCRTSDRRVARPARCRATAVSEPVGTCCIVLHTHLPWLAHHGAWPVGEEWLYQAWSTLVPAA